MWVCACDTFTSLKIHSHFSHLVCVRPLSVVRYENACAAFMNIYRNVYLLEYSLNHVVNIEEPEKTQYILKHLGNLYMFEYVRTIRDRNLYLHVIHNIICMYHIIATTCITTLLSVCSVCVCVVECMQRVSG